MNQYKFKSILSLRVFVFLYLSTLMFSVTFGKDKIPPLPFVPGSFTIAVMPDTQYYRNKNVHHFANQTKWIANNASKYNIAYVIHLGDITQRNKPHEWVVAQKAMRNLDKAKVPYSLALGNHDYSWGKPLPQRRKSPLINEYFKVDDFKKWPTFGGAEDGKLNNSYHLFEANGTKFIILSLEWSPMHKTIAWADKILAKYPERKAILATHAYLYYDNTRYDRKKPGQKWNPFSYPMNKDKINDGEMIWQKLVKKHNFILTFNGHVLGDGQGRLTSTGDNGNLVHQILVNYQMLKEGGAGYMRLVEFLPDGNTIQFKSYSPSMDKYLTDSQNQFILKLKK